MVEEEDEEEKLEAFLEWGASVGLSDSDSDSSSGCLGSCVFVSDFPEEGGRGLGAARRLKKGDLILKVPRSVLLCKDTVLMRDQFLASTISRYPHLSESQVLIVCLLAETRKGRSSFWYPYLIHLPRTYDLLASFSQFETLALQVDDAIWTSKKAFSKVHSDWSKAKALMEDISLKPPFSTLKSWLWASSTISSRTLHVPWDSAGCLCPVGDLFNYAAPGSDSSNSDSPTCVEELEEQSVIRLTDGGYEEEKGSYCFYARESYEQGQQVLLSYGTYSNLELLEHYGFLLSHNPNDRVLIHYPTCHNSWPKEALHIHQDGNPSFSLLCAMRLMETPPHLRKAAGHLAHAGIMLSRENEASVMTKLAGICKVLLEELPTTMEEDMVLQKAIDEIQSCSGFREDSFGENWVQAFGRELHLFLQVQGLQVCDLVEVCKRKKTKRSLRRWELAVQWRLHYKKILHSCILYCNETIERLVSQELSS